MASLFGTALPAAAGGGLGVDGWGDLVGAEFVPVDVGFCRLPATVPDSAPAAGVPLGARWASGLQDGSSIAVGPVAQGAAVPTAGLVVGVGDGGLVGRGAAGPGARVVVVLLVAWVARGA